MSDDTIVDTIVDYVTAKVLGDVISEADAFIEKLKPIIIQLIGLFK